MRLRSVNFRISCLQQVNDPAQQVVATNRDKNAKSFDKTHAVDPSNRDASRCGSCLGNATSGMGFFTGFRMNHTYRSHFPSTIVAYPARMALITAMFRLHLAQPSRIALAAA